MQITKDWHLPLTPSLSCTSWVRKPLFSEARELRPLFSITYQIAKNCRLALKYLPIIAIVGSVQNVPQLASFSCPYPVENNRQHFPLFKANPFLVIHIVGSPDVQRHFQSFPQAIILKIKDGFAENFE